MTQNKRRVRTPFHWGVYDLEVEGDRIVDRHGNPNVLTVDRGTSRLAQGSIAHSALVEVERFDGEPPAVAVFDPPEMVDGG